MKKKNIIKRINQKLINGDVSVVYDTSGLNALEQLGFIHLLKKGLKVKLKNERNN